MAVLGTVASALSGKWDTFTWLTVLGVVLMLMALPFAYLGAWIATRAQSKPQHA